MEDELGKFVEEVAGLCDLGDDYLSTCRALNYTKTRLQALLEMYKDCDGVGKKGACRLCFIGRGLQVVEDEWQLFHERMDNPARFLKNEGKEALVFWQTKNVSTKVIEAVDWFRGSRGVLFADRKVTGVS